MIYDIEYARQKAQDPTEQELDDLWLNTEHEPDCTKELTVTVNYDGEPWFEDACSSCINTWFKLHTIEAVTRKRLAA